MTTNLKAVIAAIGTIGLAAAPAVGQANEVYFLVGTRHVYRIGPNPYLDVSQRQQVEQQYADDVAAAQSAFNNDVNNSGVDPAVASDTLNQRLMDAASYRDFQLSQYYTPDDQILNRHPELLIEGDGPYQVIGINVNNHVWGNFLVMAPWPGFVVVGPHPDYGWEYGHYYSPYAFHAAYLGWHRGWVAGGAPVFVGLYGSSGFINIGFNASINIGLRSRGFAPGPGFRPSNNWHGTIPHAAPRAYVGGRPNWAPAGVRNGGTFGSRPGGARPGGSFNRPGGNMGARPGGSFGARPGGNMGNRPAGSFGNRPGGNVGRQADGGMGNRPLKNTGTRPGGSFGNQPARGFGNSATGHVGARPGGSFGARPGGSFGSRPGGSRPPARSGGSNKKHGG